MDSPVDGIHLFLFVAACLTLFSVGILVARATKGITIHWGKVVLISAGSLALAGGCVSIAASISAAV